MNNTIETQKEETKTKIKELLELILENENGNQKNDIPSSASYILFFILSAKETEAGKNLILSLFNGHQEIYETIQTLIDTPNCQCRSKAVDFVSNNTETAIKILFEIINKEEDQRTLREMKSIAEGGINVITNLEFQLSGKRMVIENTDEAYSQKIMQISDPRYRYKGISVNSTQDGKNLELFFY